MEIEVKQKQTDMEMNKVSVIIESKNGNDEKLAKYIEEYNGKVQVFNENRIKTVPFKEVIKFYCQNKINYCKTEEKTYIVRKPLYELENIASCFVRASKKTIVNLDHVIETKSTGIGGCIIFKLSDGTEERVARRRKNKVLKAMKERCN